MVCPNCKSDNLTRNSTFETKTESIGETVSTTVVVDMMCCELCHIEFPAIRGRQKYTLISKRRFENMIEEQRDIRKQNSEITDNLEAMEERRRELKGEIEMFRAQSEVDNLEAKVRFLESGMSGLEISRAKIKEVIDSMTAQANQSSIFA